MMLRKRIKIISEDEENIIDLKENQLRKKSPMFLLFLSVGILMIAIGVAYGLFYLDASKRIAESERLVKAEKYEEATSELEFIFDTWPIKNFGIKRKEIFDEMEKIKQLSEDKSEYAQGIEEFNKENWEKAKELLSEVSKISPYYQEAKNKIAELEGKTITKLEKEVENLENQQNQSLEKTAPRVDCATILLSTDEIQEIFDKANQVNEEAGGFDTDSLKKVIFALEAAYKTNKEPSCKSYFDKELREKEASLSNNQAENTTSPVSISNFAGYIVRIICVDSNKDNPTFSSGSGTIFGLNRLVITNSHIVEGMVLCSIGLTDDIKSPPQRWYEATVTQNISSSDIALLEPTQPLPENANTIAYNLCSPDDINLGDSVVVLGYPIVGGNTITATEGVISGFDGFLIKTSAKIEHGSSGGGAFLKNENCWFGIPTSVAQGELESLGFIINYSLIHQKSSQ